MCQENRSADVGFGGRVDICEKSRREKGVVIRSAHQRCEMSCHDFKSSEDLLTPPLHVCDQSPCESEVLSFGGRVFVV